MGLIVPSTPARARTIPAAWFAVGLLVTAGLAVATTSVYYELRPSSTPGSVTVTDDFGRAVTVPFDPARVVVLGPSVLDSMVRLGLRAQVVGVDCYTPAFGGLSADYSADQIANWSLNASMCVQVEPLVTEELLNLSPDLVLAATIVSVADVETISQTFHIPVVMVQPPTLSGIEIDVDLLGEIFGVSGAAATLSAELAGALAHATAFQQNVSGGFPTVLVTYGVDSSGYWTYGPGSFGESLIELASGASIAANATIPYPELSGEQVLTSDPHVVVYGTGFGLTLATYSGAPFWSSLSAVQDHRAFGLDSNYLTEPDPTMILVGLPALLGLLYPGSG